jgi:hypothetical protein
MSSVIYKRYIPVLMMIVISIMMISEYYIEPLQPIFKVPVNILSGWGSIIASFATLMALFSLVRQYINRIRREKNKQEVYLSYYGLAVVVITLLLGTIIYKPDHLVYMDLYFNIMLPLFFAAMSLNGFILMAALYRGFRAKDVYSVMMLITAIIIIITSTPLLVTTYPSLGSTYNWIQSVPRAAAERAFNIAVGIGMVGIALRTLTGQEKVLFGGEG